MNRKVFFTLLHKTIVAWYDDKASTIAAALAYYTTFSLAPILIIMIAIAGIFFGPKLSQQELLSQLQSTIGPASTQEVKVLIEAVDRPYTSLYAMITGIFILTLGVLGFFNQLQDGLNTVWGVKPRPDRSWGEIIKERILSFLIVVGIAFFLLVAFIFSTIISTVSTYLNTMLPSTTFIWINVNFFVSLFITTILFAIIFKILPDVIMKWRNVWLGAFITALLFTIGKILLAFYISNSGISSAFGAAGSFIAILVWVYYSAQLLFLGAEFTKIYAIYNGTQIRPSHHAMLICAGGHHGQIRHHS